MAEPRRFPPPWTVEETDACFIVRDHNDQALAYVYFEDEPGRRAAAKLLTRDEARRIAEHVAGPRVTKQPDWQGLPPLIIAEEYLKRALPYRDQAIELPDTVNSRPNWPKHFLMTHAMELAIKAYIVFATGRELRSHNLSALYERAVQNGLKRSEVVSTGLSQLNELHMVHYARFPNPVVRPVPFYISGYDDMVNQLLADVRRALGLG
jgi:HEPN domain-containing protein